MNGGAFTFESEYSNYNRLGGATITRATRIAKAPTGSSHSWSQR